MTKRHLLLLLSVCFGVLIVAQPHPRQELKKNVPFSASNNLAYPGPTQHKPSAPPKGKKPFYLTHFGRHGSRYLNNPRDYDYVLTILRKAERLDKLSPLGKDVLKRIITLDGNARDHIGELTSLGEQQMKDIARRMVENYPEVFEGDATVSARSTIVLRCVFSMENTLHQMLAMNPRLRISHTASYSDMWILNPYDKKLSDRINSVESRTAYDAYCRRRQCWQRATGQLFSDKDYFDQQVNGERLNYYLFRMAGSVQNTDLRQHLTLYDLYNDDEIYKNWQMENAYWYLGYGHTPLNGGQQPFSLRNTLRSIVSEADSCIALPRPGAQLRFGHETALLPLVCLMELNGFGLSVKDLDQLEKRGWVNYRVFPMAANIQMVFYRRDIDDEDVLVKVMLNENEATLPIKTDVAPYYHWADVRRFFLQKLDSYAEEE